MPGTAQHILAPVCLQHELDCSPRWFVEGPMVWQPLAATEHHRRPQLGPVQRRK